ncbi:MAG TPA: Hpt domain-containing protein, partial [Fibrobacteraceae bacterium]|nr:Hpt domain-containing protein [Fibrobacteraceae bacterium]
MPEESLLDEFLSESREHLSGIEQDFMLLEQDPDHPDSEVVNRIFRAVHTVKGSSGFFGLTRIGSLSHAMETLLDRIRENKIKPESPILDVLLEGLDRLGALLSDVENSNNQDTRALENRILACAKIPDETLSEKTKKERNTVIVDAFPSEVDFSAVPPGQFLYRL